jgi:hypothetical protein|tara:strand:- start:626 stop:748 length:123 start_codon:yes stop_codon:yes gene_type:complete
MIASIGRYVISADRAEKAARAMHADTTACGEAHASSLVSK